MSAVIFYGLDTHFQSRSNSDMVVNYLGKKLLYVCESSGLRILNGRPWYPRSAKYVKMNKT